jgi:LysR family glycine cleavage system transcriptional activator
VRLNSNILASLRFSESAARLFSSSRAAKELGVTQGAVSHQIRYLEDSLSCKLFYRLPRKVQLTEQGEQFGKTVASALRMLDEGAEATVASTREMLDVRLRAGPSFAMR